MSKIHKNRFKKKMQCFFIYVDTTRCLDKAEISLSIPNTLLKHELQSVIKK